MMSIKTWLSICLSVLLLVGCGGGGDATHAGVGSGGTGGASAGGSGGGSTGRSFTAGVITSVNGGVVVNGIRFDTTDADVRDVNDPDATLHPSALQPGMMVEIDGSAITDQDGQLLAKAVKVRISSQVLGRVLNINDKELLVLGMKVQVTDSTLYDPVTLPGGRSDIQLNDVIEVHGFLDSTRAAALPLVVATRIIRRNEVDQFLFFIQGLIETSGALQEDGKQRYKLVGLPFTWIYTPVDLESGRSAVRLTFPASLLTESSWPDLQTLTTSFEQSVASVKVTMPPADSGQDIQIDAHVDGVVTALDPINDQRFWINNIEVNARRVPQLACVGLKKGERVRVHGWIIGGQIHATKVTLLDKLAAADAPLVDDEVPPLTCDALQAADGAASSPTAAAP